MIRTVVYRSRVVPEGGEDAEAPVYGAHGPTPDRDVEPDGPLGRIVKYIPGETLSLILPATLLGGLGKLVVLLIAGAGAVGTPLYLHHRARHEADAKRQLPPKRFYAIAVLAYIAWILASSSPVRTAIGLRQTTAAVIVFLAAYLLPLVDDELDRPPRAVGESES